ncbi:hemicentin-1 [Trichonephila clavata]|uniref:Hemicentin-1 n=1 Tax=Trichonephila clavata TaxID=2740835 RepID=A0A8X6HKC4_TRICU|nr:hemicentin-1 [Trichonephila clavata]
MLFFTPALFLLLHFINISVAAGGTWSSWSEWSSCSVSCAVGFRKRTRACKPSTKPGSPWCQGQYSETEKCDTSLECPVHGGWSEWGKWTDCTATCGQGTTRRYRSCSNPIPINGGKPCVGAPGESQSCVAIKVCPRDGGWSSWSQWSQCSVTCGNEGSNFRYRSCNNPPPQAEGTPCQGPSQDRQDCIAPKLCPVNGQWSEWTEWTECSVTCGKGERMRRRACDNPLPEHGGQDCNRDEAGEVQIHSCSAKIEHCPVDGGWSDWSDWGPCHSPDCGSSKIAYSFRQRSCNIPVPAHNGSMCQGTFLDAGLCAQPINCAVDGHWGEWSSWNCTEFVATRKRLCDSPPPSRGGKNCKGDSTDILMREQNDEEFKKACPNALAELPEELEEEEPEENEELRVDDPGDYGDNYPNYPDYPDIYPE